MVQVMKQRQPVTVEEILDYTSYFGEKPRGFADAEWKGFKLEYHS